MRRPKEHRGWDCSQKEAGPDDRLKPVWLLASGLKTPDALSQGHTPASVLSCIPEPCVSVGCCTRCWTTAPSAARRGPKVRGQCKVWVALPRAGARTRRHTCVLKASAQPPGVPRDSALLSAASRVSLCFEGGLCVELQGSRRPKGVRACLPGTSQEGAQLPSLTASADSGHKYVEGLASRVAFRRGLVLQKTRERFQVLSGGSPVLSALSSCPRACACSHSAVENPTFRFWTFEDGGQRTVESQARQGPSRAVTQGRLCDH